jgi:hypothetical protein
MKHRIVSFAILLVVLLSAVALVTAVPRQVAESEGITTGHGQNSGFGGGVSLSHSGTLRIHIDDANITNIDLFVTDEVNNKLMYEHLPHSNISAFTVTNASTVDAQADLPRGMYYIYLNCNITSSDAIQLLSTLESNYVIITYSPSQPSQTSNPFVLDLAVLIAISLLTIAAVSYILQQRRGPK